MIRFTLRHPLRAARDVLERQDHARQENYPGPLDALDWVRDRVARRLLLPEDRERLDRFDRTAARTALLMEIGHRIADREDVDSIR